MTDRNARTVPPVAPLPKAIRTEEKTRTDGMLEPAPGSVGYRKNSPPPFSRPPPRSEPTTPTERELARLRAEVAQLKEGAERRVQRVEMPSQPGWVEPPWWRTSGGMVKVLGAFFAGCATLGVGGWFASRPPEAKPPPPTAADSGCPPFEDQNAPRSALCMRINQLEDSIGELQGVRDAKRAREARERKMLGELPQVKKPIDE